MVYSWLARLERILYPPHCLLCARPSHTRRELCHDCTRDLPWNRPACPRCALPLPAASGERLCGQCLKSPPLWDDAQSPLIYGWPLDQLLQRFKFHADLATGQALGELLAEFLATTLTARPDLLIPVPLHHARLRTRGFNQALELARSVRARLRLHLEDRICVRHKNTAVQSTLAARKRRQNMHGAFVVRRPVAGLHVAVLDDVITTGATMTAVSQALREAGAARISVWSLARAVRAP